MGRVTVTRFDELKSMISQDCDSCINWEYSKTRDGYGQVRFNGTTRRAHKLAYCLNHGIDYKSVVGVIMHSCDNPKCINHKHLSVGSQADNMADCKNKGRVRDSAGEANSRAVISKANSDSIRMEYSTGRTSYGKLAKKYGVGKSTILRVIKFGYLE